MSADNNKEILRRQREYYNSLAKKQREKLNASIENYFNSNTDPADWWKNTED